MNTNKIPEIRNTSNSKGIIILVFTIVTFSFLNMEIPESFATTTEWNSEISVGILETEPSEFEMDLQIITNSKNNLKLEWSPPTISEDQILTGYEIFRKTSYTNYETLIENLNPDKTTFVDLELPAGYYGYLVKPILEKKPSDSITKHGIDRNNNLFNSYLLGQELLAQQTLNKLLNEKSIQKNSMEEPITHYSSFLKRAEDPILQNQIKQEILKAEKLFLHKYDVRINH